MHHGIRAKAPYKASKYTTHSARHPQMYINRVKIKRSEKHAILNNLKLNGKIHWNRLAHIFMIPFMIEKCWQALSSINATLSSSLLSLSLLSSSLLFSLLPTTHPKDCIRYCIRYWRSVPYALHSSNQWKMFFTFPDSHWRHVLLLL